MVSIKFFFIFALAIACVFAVEESVRAKKQVLLGGAYPYAYSSYAAAPLAAPLTAPVAAPVAAPLAYSAGYAAYPYGVAPSYYY